MMNGVIAKQEAEEYQAESIRLASKAKRAAQAKLREVNPNFDKQRAAAIANNKKLSQPLPVDPSFVSNTVRTVDVAKAAKGPRIVRPPPQKKQPLTVCILCGAKVSDIRQHKHDIHYERLYISSPTHSIKDNAWVTIYEGGAPGLGKRQS